MARRAILIGNSVSYSALDKSVTSTALRRTLGRLASLLGGLEDGLAFEVSICVDDRAAVVRRKVERLAAATAGEDDLLLLHYFGHGVLSDDNKLLFIHPGTTRAAVERLPLESIETRIRENGVRQSLFLIDCCYAGAAKRDFPWGLTGRHCRIASTVPSFKAYVEYQSDEPPIGRFTSALMDAFTDPDACVASDDDRVTAQSLFEHLQRALSVPGLKTLQEPAFYGALPGTLFEYQAIPSIRPGFARSANPKSAYAKVVAMCRTVGRRRFSDIADLRNQLVEDFPRSFRTLHKHSDGTFTYEPVRDEVVARYARFMTRLGLLRVGAGLHLTELGLRLARKWDSDANAILLTAIDQYFAERGGDRKKVMEACRLVLRSRRIPTQQEIADRLSLGGLRLLRGDVDVLLELLGYIGTLQITGSRAYFPWPVGPRQSGDLGTP